MPLHQEKNNSYPELWRKKVRFFGHLTLKLEIIFSSCHTFSLTWLLAGISFASSRETKVESDLSLKPC